MGVYGTHGLGPLLYITGDRVKTVRAIGVAQEVVRAGEVRGSEDVGGDLVQVRSQLLQLRLGLLQGRTGLRPHLTAELLGQWAIPHIGGRQNLTLLVQGRNLLGQTIVDDRLNLTNRILGVAPNFYGGF